MLKKEDERPGAAQEEGQDPEHQGDDCRRELPHVWTFQGGIDSRIAWGAVVYPLWIQPFVRGIYYACSGGVCSFG